MSKTGGKIKGITIPNEDKSKGNTKFKTDEFNRLDKEIEMFEGNSKVKSVHKFVESLVTG